MRALIAAFLTAAIVQPALAQDAGLAEAATAIAAIQQDDIKRKAYCELQDLLVKAEEATAKQDEAQAKSLTAEAGAKSAVLGDEFEKVAALDVDIDPASEDGRKYFEAWEALEKSCSPT